MKKVIAMLLVCSLVFSMPGTCLAREAYENDPVSIEMENELEQMIELMNNDPIEFEDVIESGGTYTKTYTIQSENGEESESKLTITYNPPPISTYGDRWSGTKSAPAVGSTIDINWDYKSPLVGGFVWLITIKRVYGNAITGTYSRLVGDPPPMFTTVAQTSEFAGGMPDNKVKCEGTLIFMLSAAAPLPTVYQLTANFTIAEDTIAFIFEYSP